MYVQKMWMMAKSYGKQSGFPTEIDHKSSTLTDSYKCISGVSNEAGGIFR